MGFAETVGTFEADVHGLAAPLFGPAGACVGAVAVATPAARLTPALRDRIITEITKAAREITALWGGRGPADLSGLWDRAA